MFSFRNSNHSSLTLGQVSQLTGLVIIIAAFFREIPGLVA